MKTWTLVLSLFGITVAAKYCVPERFTFREFADVVYPITKAKDLDVVVEGNNVGELPIVTGLNKDATAAAGASLRLSWDLSSTPLALKVGPAGVVDTASHQIHTSDAAGADDSVFSLTFTFKGVVDKANQETSDYKAEVDLLCASKAQKLVYTYANNLKKLGTTADWYVMYQYDLAGKKINVRVGADPAALVAEAGLLAAATDQVVSDDCIAALKTAADKAGGAGAFLVAKLVAPGANKLTLVFLNDQNLAISGVAIVPGASNTGIVVNKGSYPSAGGTEKAAYKFSDAECIDTQNYANLYSDPTTAGTCPANGAAYTAAYSREPACTVEKLAAAATQATCNTAYCCWIGGTENKCLAKPAPACSLSKNTNDAYDLGNDPRTIVKVGGVELVATGTGANTDKFKTIFLGEEVEFSCKTDQNGGVNLLTKDTNFANLAAFGDFTKVTFKCLQNEDKKTTDFHAIFNRIKCSEACGEPKISDTVTIDVDFAKGKPVGTAIKFTCKDKFGTSTGLTAYANTVACTAGKTDYTTGKSAKVCFQCTTAKVDASKNAKYSAETVLPTKTVDYSCNDGFSFTTVKDDQNIRTKKSIRCEHTSATDGPGTVALASTDQAQCIEDCKLTLGPDHGLKFTLNNLPATILSVPQDMKYVAACVDEKDEANPKTLPFGQDKNLQCAKVDTVANPNAKPAAITVKSCHAPCSVVKLKETYNLESKTTVGQADFKTLSDKTVPMDTPLKLASCVGDKQFLFTEKTRNEIACSDTYYDFAKKEFKGIIGCYKPCSVFAAIGDGFTAGDVVDNGGDASLTGAKVLADKKLPPNTQVKFMCKDPEHTVEGTKNNYFTAVCGTNGDDITTKTCYPSCKVDTLKNPNKNTLVKSHTTDTATKVAMGEHVDIKCADANYVMAFDVSKVVLDNYGVCKRTSTGVELQKETTETKGYCIAKATVVKPTSTSAGPMKFKGSVTLPSDRDDTDDFAIENVVVKDGADTLISTVATPSGKNSWDFEYEIQKTTGWEDKLKAGYTLTAKTIKYKTKGEITLPVATVPGFYAGPPALDSDAVTISVVGKKDVTFKFKAGLDAAVAKYTVSGKYEPVFAMKVLLGAKDIKSDQAKTITALMSETKYDWGALLEPLKEYTVKITSSVAQGAGGEMSTTFKTGHEAPTLSFSDVTVSSTARDVTITLAASTADGDIKVKYTLSTKGEQIETKKFADKKTTISYTDLTPLTAYTFTVVLLTSDDVPSQTVTGSFSQGPTKPKAIETTAVTITDKSVSIKVDTADGITYRIKVYEYDTTKSKFGDTPVQNIEFTKPAADRRKRSTKVVDKKIENLKANTKYKIELSSEGLVGGVKFASNPVSYEFTTYACDSQTLRDTNVTPSLPQNAALAVHYNPDPNVVFTLTCPKDLVVNEKDGAGGLTMKTTQTTVCTTTGWKTYIHPCVAKPDETDPEAVTDDNTGLITGIIIAGVLLLLLVFVLVIVVIARKRRGGGGGTENGTSQKYSPRDNEIAADGGEAWRNPYYRDTDDNEKPIQENEVVLVPLHNSVGDPDKYPDPPQSLGDGVEPSQQSEEKQEVPAEEPVEEPAADGTELKEVVVTTESPPENEYDNVDPPPGEPDIGAKENGDNVSMGSQTQKVELGDEEEAVEATVPGATAEEKV